MAVTMDRLPRNLAEKYRADDLRVMGIIREYEGPDKGKVSYQDIGPAVEHLKPRFKENIATELGFTDQSALARRFRKNMGYTPLQYRRRYL